MSNIVEKFKEATVENLNLILSKNSLNNKTFNFEEISEKYNNFLVYVAVLINKKNENYEKGKKKFGKFINYNYKFLKNHLELDENILVLFEDTPNSNWYYLFLSFVSYLSYLNQQEPESIFNYKGMIDKIMIKIEEYSESDIESEKESEKEPEDLEKKQPNIDTNSLMIELNKHIKPSEKTPNIMKNLLGDIKEVLSDDTVKTRNIMDISKDLTTKYQKMIEDGDMNISDILSGVMGLLNDPDSLVNEFDDIDASKLPDPTSILNEMSNDPNLKNAMNMMTDKNSMFGNMMSNMMNNSKSQTDNKSIGELEKEIEQMMREVQEKEDEEKVDEEKVDEVDEVD
jgi:hypothetical protein